MALVVEEHMRPRALPFFDELLAAAHPAHDEKRVAVDLAGPTAEIEREAEAVAGLTSRFVR